MGTTVISLCFVCLIFVWKYFIRRNHLKILPILKIQIRMWEVSTVSIYPGLENGWIGYEQLAGSRYTSTKRAEMRYLAACVAIMCTKIDRQIAAVGELWHAPKSPLTRVSGTLFPWSIEGTTISPLPNKKNFMDKIFLPEYSCNKFSDNEYRPKIFPRRKKG